MKPFIIGFQLFVFLMSIGWLVFLVWAIYKVVMWLTVQTL